MLHYQRALLRGIAYPLRVARRRPLASLLALCVTLMAGGGGLDLYARSQWRAAQAALAADRPAEARQRLAICLFVWPRSPEVHHLAARAARLTNDIAAAEDELNQAIRVNGEATESVQLEFLLLRVQTGELDEVAATLVKSVEQDHPESPLILETLARAYITLLRYKSALACLNRWIELRPNEVKAYQWRGVVLERLDQYKAAAADYNKALELDPDLLPVRLRVAEMLMEDK